MKKTKKSTSKAVPIKELAPFLFKDTASIPARLNKNNVIDRVADLLTSEGELEIVQKRNAKLEDLVAHLTKVIQNPEFNTLRRLYFIDDMEDR